MSASASAQVPTEAEIAAAHTNCGTLAARNPAAGRQIRGPGSGTVAAWNPGWEACEQTEAAWQRAQAEKAEAAAKDKASQDGAP